MNILGFNIGQNYKGILNLGSTINTPLSATLQSVTDGTGVASPLQLSTTQVSNVFTGSHTILWRANSILTDYSGWHQSDGTFVILKKDGNSLWFNIDSAVNFSSGFGSTGRSSINAAGNWTIGGAFTNTARVHVRGDGTNPIARFESNSGVSFLKVNQAANATVVVGDDSTANFFTLSIDAAGNANITGNSSSGKTLRIGNGGNSTQYRGTIADLTGGIYNFVGASNFTALNTYNAFTYDTSITSPAGASSYRIKNIIYTINNSGAQTGTATGIFLNATETALNGMAHNLMDLQVGGVSSFRVGRAGLTTIGVQSGSVWNVVFDMTSGTNPGGYMNWKLANDATSYYSQFMQGGDMNFFTTGSGYNYGMNFSTSGVSRLRISPTGLIQFGGTTASFPALRVNGTTLEVVLANATAGSGFTGLSASVFNAQFVGSQVAINIFDTTRQIGTGGSGHIGFKATNFTFNNDNFNVANASAIVQIDSTTKGFLPPRQTEAQRLAIAGGTPAIGLMVYQTDGTDGLYVYKAGGWQFIA